MDLASLVNGIKAPEVAILCLLSSLVAKLVMHPTALLNMTHSEENRKELVNAGAVPVLVSLLSSTDPDVQYYCTTALSNIAVDEANRKKLTSTFLF